MLFAPPKHIPQFGDELCLMLNARNMTLPTTMTRGKLRYVFCGLFHKHPLEREKCMVGVMAPSVKSFASLRPFLWSL